MAMATQPMYENVQIDGHGHDDSSTDVDESLLGDEKHWRTEAIQRPVRRSKRSRLRTSLESLRWLLDTALLLVILGLLVRDQMRQPPANLWDSGGDFTGVGPRLPQQIKKFKSDQSYAPMDTSKFFTDEVLQRWNELMPVGMGFVWVNETHRYHDLPTPIRWPDKTVFTSSVTHQLHCLFAIVQTYSGIKANHPIPDDHHWHMIHCFDYMREAITCSSDMALEGLETTFPDDNGGSDGWDSTHVCKDYSKVKEYLESVRAYDDQLIY